MLGKLIKLIGLLVSFVFFINKHDKKHVQNELLRVYVSLYSVFDRFQLNYLILRF